MSPEKYESCFKTIAIKYDAFLTALDFPCAEWANALGLRVFVYDMLAWYRPDHEVPRVLQTGGEYIAQDFFGVRERIASRPKLFPRAHVVPPLIVPEVPTTHRDVVAINLGGLQNPFCSVEDTVAYARICLDAIRDVLGSKQKRVVVASASIKMMLGDDEIRTLTYQQMQSLLPQVRLAFMTPGLGNIYEAARYNVPTVWLPPSNDSQGQQLMILSRNGMSDGYVDWTDIMAEGEVDYFSPQQTVLNEITVRIREVLNCSAAQKEIAAALRRVTQPLLHRAGSRAAALVDRFGCGGAERAASLVLQRLAAT
jgi:hypothetical protein